MALNPNELLSTTTQAAAKRLAPTMVQLKKFAAVAGAPTLGWCTPVARKKSTGFWQVWKGTAKVNEVQTLTVDATGGTFALTFDGEKTAAIAEAASAATLQAALETLSNIQPGDVVVAGSAGGPWTITFGGQWAGKDVPAIVTDPALLTGGAGTAVITTTTAGVDPDEQDVIRGFIPEKDGAVLHAADETLHNVALAGLVHRDDVVLPAGESQATLDAALATLKTQGWTVQGLHAFG